MANHAYVLTQKPMTLASVEQVLKNTNEKYFFGLMIIAFDEDAKTWHLSFEDVDRGRCCWINTANSFEIRHGGGSDFIWWVDSLIQDEIAREFDGQVKDDGIGQPDTKTWNTALTFSETVKNAIDNRVDSHEIVSLIDRYFVYRKLLLGCSKQYMRKLRKSSKAC